MNNTSHMKTLDQPTVPPPLQRPSVSKHLQGLRLSILACFYHNAQSWRSLAIST